MSKNTSTARKSMKGKHGKVGAPPKPTKFPKTPFTMAKLFAVNAKGKYAQCQLSLRNKVTALLNSGDLVALQPKKQPNGAVGRPSEVFVQKENYNAAKMTKAGSAPVTKTRKTRTAPAVIEVANVNNTAPSTAPEVVTINVASTENVPVETANLPGPIADVISTPAPEVNSAPIPPAIEPETTVVS